MQEAKNKTKNKKVTWNLAPLFSGDNDPKMALERKIVWKENYKFINKWKNRTDYLKNPKILRRALDEYEKLCRNYSTDGNEGYYFWLRAAQDQNNLKIKARLNQVDELSKNISNDIQFFTLRLSKVPPAVQSKFLKYKDLYVYRHFLENLFAEAKYLLSESEEKIVTLKAEVSHSNWVKMVSRLLSRESRKIITRDGQEELKNFSEIFSLVDSVDKKTRDSASAAINEILEKYSDIAEAELNSILANKKIDDNLRKIARPDLTRHLTDDMDSRVVDTLVDCIVDNFPIAQRYYRFRARLMGVSKLKYHERNVPYGQLDNKSYSFDEAKVIVGRAFKGADEELYDIFNSFIEGGQLDVYPSEGKRVGAFCAYNLLTQPVYIFLNHTGKLRDVLTIAHEAGHGINDELMRKKQNSLNFITPFSTAEVASTFMEGFVLDEILKEADDELRLSMMIAQLNESMAAIFMSAARYKFEEELHKKFREKGYLSKGEVGKIFQKHMFSYMGGAVEKSPGSENWWIYAHHLRSFFYNYQYAIGQLIAKYMHVRLKKDPQFMSKIKEFLSTGKSDSPKNIFKKLGIDIGKREFWETGIAEVEKLLKETEALARRLKKI